MMHAHKWNIGIEAIVVYCFFFLVDNTNIVILA